MCVIQRYSYFERIKKCCKITVYSIEPSINVQMKGDQREWEWERKKCMSEMNFEALTMCHRRSLHYYQKKKKTKKKKKKHNEWCTEMKYSTGYSIATSKHGWFLFACHKIKSNHISTRKKPILSWLLNPASFSRFRFRSHTHTCSCYCCCFSVIGSYTFFSTHRDGHQQNS